MVDNNLNSGRARPVAPPPPPPPQQPPESIPVNFGINHPSPFPALVAAAVTDQAVLYDTAANRLPADWAWSATNRTNFICHSQGGTTIRYLIELLSGASDPDLPQFLGTNRQSWVKSVVTLGTPHKGTTVTEVVDSILNPRGLDPLIDFVTSCSFEDKGQRLYDLHLDHWGFHRTNPGQTYQEMRAEIAPTIAAWWAGPHNGLFDNSIQGVTALDLFAPNPSPDIYYFTMSFCATQPFLDVMLTAQDVNEFLALFPLNWLWNPLGVFGRVAAPLQSLGSILGVLPSLHATLTSVTRMANRHLGKMGYFSQIPAPGTQLPRSDMLPLIMFFAYAMGGRNTTPPGWPAGNSEAFKLNDGIVNTESMDGPVGGPVNYGNFTQQLAATGGQFVKGEYWHLGTNGTVDHADQVGVFTDPITNAEVKVMYLLFAELGDRLL
ncbi:hypothetical protein BKA67DRAFT_695816 [Truncatella angustata]|uniref:Lipase-like C-terminal domain-containing protein n=1 Tax=Truncatella angustata TaxID=152316 RepID=A0A9P8RH02_9PEZI|nr:uncharacterized protein BKA67DRAFT_695816 [Truncatella angustata]KAH6645863.1 hypothetical protein BKA67DRAFT_695816 [Truncatella angustata]KAH8205251.1 hypothetical protein TruAng_000498 [Truncatella angustata]